MNGLYSEGALWIALYNECWMRLLCVLMYLVYRDDEMDGDWEPPMICEWCVCGGGELGSSCTV